MFERFTKDARERVAPSRSIIDPDDAAALRSIGIDPAALRPAVAVGLRRAA